MGVWVSGFDVVTRTWYLLWWCGCGMAALAARAKTSQTNYGGIDMAYGVEVWVYAFAALVWTW
jgi:hypothetical protein